ncbi:MAG: hypothetical protein ACT4O5_08785 [Gammaproteobacteria bacterium]
MQFKFTNLEDAKAKAKALVSSGEELEDSCLHIIHDKRQNQFYVEDGCPMVRPQFEEIVWSL